MAQIIMTKWPVAVDGSVKAKAMTFLQKLAEDDTLPGLHVEPIKNSADPKVRTGRVDDSWRAVLFRLDSDRETHYVVHGVWPHDDAIKVAKRVVLRINPINGLVEISQAAEGDAVAAVRAPAPVRTPAVGPAKSEPLLVQFGRTREELVGVLGLPAAVADEALAAADEDAIVALAERHEGWVGLMLIDLAAGEPVAEITEKLQLVPVVEAPGDSDLVESLRKPAARTQFAFIEDQDELRRVIESGDFGAWRIFLHPEQRTYVERRYNGAFRLSGGAGTGKTVVLVHRARALARANPDARIVLTTFTTNLADAAGEMLTQLDPAVARAPELGAPGVFIAGVDALAAAVIREADTAISSAVAAVLGDERADVRGRTSHDAWREVAESANGELPRELANETFLAAEYSLIVVPNRILDEEGYLRVRRAGRGTRLDRARRSAVWRLSDAYRMRGRMDGTIDFVEAAAIAAAHLDAHPAERPADHVLVDEGQDLSPAQWQLVRALVPEGPDDLFITEDSHQRIYGPKVVLGRYGIRIVGRSRRLTLNYRTTAQNLRFAMTMLDGLDFVDLEDEPETTGYRSARSGPDPVVEGGSLTDELDSVVTHVKAWLDGGAEPATIAVLVPDRYQRDRIVAALAAADVPVRGVDRDRPPPDCVLVMTRHRSKGMEFSKVILTDVGYMSPGETARLDAMDESEWEDAVLRTRSLDYVAATRARDDLVILRRDSQSSTAQSKPTPSHEPSGPSVCSTTSGSSGDTAESP